MTATLPHHHVDIDPGAPHSRGAVVARWHELRRIAGAIAFGLGLVSGIVLAWPSMAIVAVLGAAVVADATLAIRSRRTRVGPTLVADITFTGVGLVAASVPPPAIGVVVAYYVLVLAVLGSSIKAWPIGLYAVVIGVASSVAPLYLDMTDGSVERSLVAGIIVVAVFGVCSIAMVKEFTTVHERDSEETDRRLEIADAIARASTALVAHDDARALGSALDAIRSAMGVSVVFVERNVEDPDLGLAAVVVERASERVTAHPSVDRRTIVPWAGMPGARAHLEGGAPFFYRVEEARGTSGDRGGDQGLRVEVNVPISLNGAWVGVIGAADEDAERIWRTDDLVLLRTLADLTAAFWQREEQGKVRDTLIGSLDGKLRHIEAVASASRSLLGEHAIDLEPAMASIGMAAGVDEVFITSTVADDDGEAAADVVAGWAVATGAPAVAPAGARWRYADLDGVRSTLQHGELATGSLGGAPFLAAAIEAGGSWFGSVGFVVHDDRKWSSNDEAFLRTFADMLSAFYERSRTRERIEASLQAKDQLIASVSHELRTPLTVVGGMAEELRSAGDDFDVESRDQLLAVIQQESAEMADLVEDLLVAARSQDGSLPVFPEHIDLALVSKGVLSHLAVPETARVAIDDHTVVAYADPVRVRQVIRNLVTNAFRYGGPSVAITFGSTATHAFVDVTDDGDGIPDEDREAVFEPYRRASSVRRSKASVGLGLTLSRRLAELMGGSLDLLEGHGCTFRLTVPLPAAEDA